MREDGASGGAPLPAGGFFLHVNLVFLTTIASYGLAFVYVLLVSRELGPEGRGVTALYQSAVNLGFAFFSLGIGTAVVYYLGRRQMTARQSMEAGLSMTLFALFLTAITIAILVPTAGDSLRADDVPYWLALLAIPAVVQNRVIDSVLRAQGRFIAMNLLDLLLPMMMVAGVLALSATDELTIESTVYVWSFSFLPPLVIGYVLLGSESWPRRLASLRELAAPTRFGMQGQLGNLIQLLNYRLDSYLILILVSATGVGFYANAVTLSEGLWFIANSVSVVLLTSLTSGDPESAARLTPVVCRNTLLATALAAIPGAIAAAFAIPLLFGEAWQDSLAPFLWLLPGTVALSATKVLAAYVFSRGKPMLNAGVALATLVVTLILDLALIPLLGVSGAAIASSLAYCLSLALTALVYRSLSGQSIREALIPQMADTQLYFNGMRSSIARLRGQA